VRDDIAARLDELTVITPEVLDNFELALRDIYDGRTSHNVDNVKSILRTNGRSAPDCLDARFDATVHFWRRSVILIVRPTRR
jgi:hypothetical protein